MPRSGERTHSEGHLAYEIWDIDYGFVDEQKAKGCVYRTRLASLLLLRALHSVANNLLRTSLCQSVSVVLSDVVYERLARMKPLTLPDSPKLRVQDLLIWVSALHRAQ